MKSAQVTPPLSSSPDWIEAPPGCSIRFCDAAYRHIKQDKQFRLYPEEEALLSKKAVERRITQFTRGRVAAHAALRALGAPDGPLVRDDSGSPMWPKGFVGSISHNTTAAVSIVGLSRQWLGLGIDIETRSRTGPEMGVIERIAYNEERNWVLEDSATKGTRALMLFSAKEATFKALFPPSRTMFWFEDVTLAFDAARSVFRCTLLKALGDVFPLHFTFDIKVGSHHDLLWSLAAVQRG